MRAARLGMTLVGTSVADERAFSAMTFVKNVLRASLSTTLVLCMRMKLQEWFDLESFPYHELEMFLCRKFRFCRYVPCFL
jgi:hypothetical protein